MLLLSTIVAMVVLDAFLPAVSLPLFALRLIGLLPLAAGVALNLLADRDMKRARTTVKPFLPTTTLLTTRVFGLTRNPMYLGFVLITFGIWALLGSLTPGIAVAAFAGALDHYFVPFEEEKLARTFGPEYEGYRRRVRRWL
jgi:protein-S-isoprenylcysteine O-methyltransferase Ste14